VAFGSTFVLVDASGRSYALQPASLPDGKELTYVAAAADAAAAAAAADAGGSAAAAAAAAVAAAAAAELTSFGLSFSG